MRRTLLAESTRMETAMSTTILSTARAIMIATGIALSASGAATAQSENARVAIRDVGQIQMVDDITAIVTARGQDYLVTFQSPCRIRQHAGFFVFNRDWLGTFLDRGDRLIASEPVGSCTVESVNEAQEVPIRTGEE